MYDIAVRKLALRMVLKTSVFTNIRKMFENCVPLTHLG